MPTGIDRSGAGSSDDALSPSPSAPLDAGELERLANEMCRNQPAPARFEAGTASIADAVALGTALDYVQRIGLESIARYERELLAYATADGRISLGGGTAFSSRLMPVTTQPR